MYCEWVCLFWFCVVWCFDCCVDENGGEYVDFFFLFFVGFFDLLFVVDVWGNVDMNRDWNFFWCLDW